MRLLWIFLFVIAFLPRSGAQCPEGLGDYLTGFSDLKADQFSFLDDQLDSVYVVGYGEDTHGAAEFTQLAGELLKYLVRKHTFTGIVIETMVGEGVYLDAYVQGTRDDRDFILHEINSSWRYRTAEFVDLLEWMRAYNAEHPERPIHLYGSEMQFVQSDATLVREYLAELGHDVAFGSFDKHLWQSFSPEERETAFRDYHRLREYMLQHGYELAAASSREAYDRMLHHVEVIGQFALTVNQPREQYRNDLRDLYATDNLFYPFQDGARDVRLLYWTHNAHAGDWVNNGMVDVVGHQLRKRMGTAYYNLATDFGNGSFVAVAPKQETWSWQVIDFTLDPTTFTACLDRAATPNAFLNLRAAREDPDLRNYLDAPLRVMYGAGAQYYGNMTTQDDTGRAFDGILYLRSVHPIEQLKAE